MKSHSGANFLFSPGSHTRRKEKKLSATEAGKKMTLGRGKQSRRTQLPFADPKGKGGTTRY